MEADTNDTAVIELPSFVKNAGEKFSLYREFGTIWVPEDDVPEKRLTRFRERYRNKFLNFDHNQTDQNYPNPTKTLVPGERFWVRVFQQIISGYTTAEHRMEFLRKEGADFVGAQGASLLFETKRDEFPQGKYYAFYDEPGRLWKDGDNTRRLPIIHRLETGHFNLISGNYYSTGHENILLVCFNGY